MPWAFIGENTALRYFQSLPSLTLHPFIIINLNENVFTDFIMSNDVTAFIHHYDNVLPVSNEFIVAFNKSLSFQTSLKSDHVSSTEVWDLVVFEIIWPGV